MRIRAIENQEVPQPCSLFKSKLLWNQLKEFNCLGPVVLLIPGNPSSTALLFTPLFPTPLRYFLPISRAEVGNLHEILQFSVQTRGDDDQPLHPDTMYSSNSSESEPQVPPGDSAENNPRSLRRNLQPTAQSVDMILERL